MTKWNLDPAGIRGVVERTGHQAERLEGAAKTYGEALQGAAESSGSNLVASALAGFAEHHKPTLEGMAQRAGRVLNGAVNATKAYMHGDLQMAANAQHAAVSPPADGDQHHGH
ncbi:DUF6507 family protein [Krasilnikovia sp. MM14-A1259]|uniref:DUF6507 family protein n=1 Tax=Krasilnikovia sp. MM14-A1259 TaxID=3373539 RepID=UPI00381A8D13